MKTKFVIYSVLFSGLLLTLMLNCKKEPLKVAPTVTIAEATNITANSATVSSTITADGGTEVLSRGVCWNINGTPTISDSKTTDGKGMGSYTSSLTSLSPGTTYNLKSYATNAIGTAYSSQTSFKTLALLATLTTTDASAITSISVSSGGNITNDGGADVTARGVCWSTAQNPTIADSKTSDATGPGIFTSSITGLTPGTTYYIRSYSTNSIGTAYGNQVTAITLAILPTLTTADLSSITSSSATSGGNITNDGGAAITARGVCWGANQSPTIADNKTSDATGKGVFSSNMTGLAPGSTYYIRAYATNSIGTAYGNQVTTIISSILPTISTTIASEISANSASSGGVILNDGGSSVTSQGVCWSTLQSPTTADNKTTETISSGTFKSLLTELKSKTTYYYRAYATNKIGTAYGNQLILNTNESKLGVVDISQSTKWDYWVTAKNGDSYFLKETSNKPTAILLKFSGSTVRTPIFFNQQGFPEKVIIGDVVYIFDNYNGKFVDIAAILPNGVIDVVKKVETEINWDLYMQKGAALYASIVLNNVGRGLGAVPCALKIGAAKASFGLLWPYAAWSCTTYGTSLTADIAEEEFGVSNDFTEFAGQYSAADFATDCAAKVGDPIECLFSLAADSYDYLSDELRELDKRQQQIADAKYVMSTGFKVTTALVTDCTFNSAKVGGNVTNDGVNAILERGVYYSTGANPEISGTKFQMGTGTGDFSSTLTGLLPNTTYLLKAFARSSQKVEYGSQVTFKTSSNQIPSLTTTSTTSITSSSATSGGNITSDGGATVTTRGVCWSTSSTPTTSNTKTTNGTGTGSYTSSITGLSPNTTYYVRAYATNSVNTAYGNQVTFTTGQTTDIPTVTTNAIGSITQTTATSGGNVTSDGNLTVTARGVCWSSSSSSPTISNSKTTNGTGTGSFTSSITGLSANTTYYVRAYANNSAGTAYGTQVSFVTTSSISNGSVSDVDGNSYSTVAIGTQVWIGENLKTTKYNDNTAIPLDNTAMPLVSDSTSNTYLTTPAYSWYNNDAITYKNKYGALYNWYAVNTGKLCPAGWHVPSDAEWTTLTTFLGGATVAGGKLKEAGIGHWLSPNTGATNISGFTALPSSYRSPYSKIGQEGTWWSSSEGSNVTAVLRYMYYSGSEVGWGSWGKSLEYSVRCLKD